MRESTVFLLCCFVSVISPYKILFYSPNYSRSHMSFIGKLADILVDAGHDVVVFRPLIFDDNPQRMENCTKARLIFLQRTHGTPVKDHLLKDEAWTIGNQGIWDAVRGGIEVMKKFGQATSSICESILADDEIHAQLKSEHFDIGFLQIFDTCAGGLFQKIALTKFILLSSIPAPVNTGAWFGVPYSLSFVPDTMPPPPHYGSFRWRAFNIGSFWFCRYLMHTSFEGSQGDVVRRHFPDFNSAEFFGKASLFFINSDEHVDYARPISHKMVYIGGFALHEPGQLDKNYIDILDGAKKGAVLVSFGSIAKSTNMPPEAKQAFIDSFKEFPDIVFIWKYENPEELKIDLPNVHLVKWVPQTGVLSMFGSSAMAIQFPDHPNVIGFVTHGGMNSVSEAVHFGVPMICIFLFGDQMRNCRMVEAKELAIVRYKNDINRETIVSGIRELTQNKKYLINARGIAEMIKSKPMPPAQRVIQYTQYAAAFDVASTLDMAGRRLNVFLYYNLDVYFAFVFAVIVFISASVTAIRFSFRILRSLFHLKRKLD